MFLVLHCITLHVTNRRTRCLISTKNYIKKSFIGYQNSRIGIGKQGADPALE